MIKIIILGMILLAVETSAYRWGFNSTDFVQRQEANKERNIQFRELSSKRNIDPKIRYNTTARLYTKHSNQRPTIMDQMNGKAFFYYRPEKTVSQNSNLERKSGESLKISQKVVNDTIREVEAIMKNNPHIPRLSHEEMINIIKNITDSNSYSPVGSSIPEKSREEYIRSLMLVMPFNTNNLSNSMIQDLYTKPPITEIIDTIPTTTPKTNEWRIVVGELSTESYDVTKGSTPFRQTTTTPRYTTVPKDYKYTSRRPTYTSMAPTPAYNTTKYKNKYATFGEPPTIRRNLTTPHYPNLTTKEPNESVSRITFTTEKPTTVYKYPENGNRRIRPKTTIAPFIVTATSVTPFKRIPAQVTIPTPLKKDTVLIRDDVKELLASIGLFPTDQSGHVSTTTTTQQFKATTTPAPFPLDIKQGVNTLTPEMQSLMKSFGLLDNEIPTAKVPASKEKTTTQVFNLPPPEPTVDIGSYVAFKRLPTHTSSGNMDKQTMGSDMKEFLALYGLLPVNESDSSTVKHTYSDRRHKSRNTVFSINERKFEGADDDLIENNTKEDNGTKSGAAMDLNIETEMLPIDMKNVLHTLGLIPALSEETVQNKNTGSELDEALVTTTTKPEETASEITASSTISTKRIISDIEEIQISTTEKVLVQTTTTKDPLEKEDVVTEGHIFNPSETVHDQESLENLSKILKTVHLIANGTSQDEMESLLNNQGRGLLQSDEGIHQEGKIKSLEQAENPPDPLSYEELVQIINSAKNEIKRQQPDNVTSSNTTDSTESETSTIQASESSDRNPSIEDLAASFGGTTSDEDESELPSPPRKPNGLYFLLDWNSFLEVGEDNSRVNLRFAPKVGDSRNFLPVAVP